MRPHLNRRSGRSASSPPTAALVMVSLLGLCALGSGCASTEPDEPSFPGIAANVEVLDEGFVRFEGNRMGLEWFLLEMRERARAAHGDVARLPKVFLSVPEGTPGVDARWLDRVETELRKAGIVRLKYMDT